MAETTRTTWTGWWQTKDRWGQAAHFEAYRRDDDADWFDLYPAQTWWAALNTALKLAASIPGCRFEGNPATFTDDIDRRQP